MRNVRCVNAKLPREILIFTAPQATSHRLIVVLLPLTREVGLAGQILEEPDHLVASNYLKLLLFSVIAP